MKIDYKKELKHLYKASVKKAEIVDVPQMNFLMIDGEGDPNTSVPLCFTVAGEPIWIVTYYSKVGG